MGTELVPGIAELRRICAHCWLPFGMHRFDDSACPDPLLIRQHISSVRGGGPRLEVYQDSPVEFFLAEVAPSSRAACCHCTCAFFHGEPCCHCGGFVEERLVKAYQEKGVSGVGIDAEGVLHV